MDRSLYQIVNTLWWVSLVQGIIALAFGFAALFWPGMTLVTLVYLFSAYIVAAGIMNVVMGVTRTGRGGMWILSVVLGVLEVGVGIYAIRHLDISTAALILLVGGILIVRGIFELVSAFMEDAPDGANRALLVLVGALSVVAGVVIVLNPASGGLAFVWALGAYALVVGALAIARAAQARALLSEADAVRAAL